MRWVGVTVFFAAGLLSQTSTPSAAEIAARSVEAMGGAAQFATVESIRIHGRMRLGEEAFTPVTVMGQRPDKFRMELSAGPDRIVQAYDGDTGWQSVSGEHDQAPVRLSGDALAHLVDMAANVIGGPLLDLEKRGNKVVYAGREAANGLDCFKLEVTLNSGDKRVLFIDPLSFREVQEEYSVPGDGEPAIVQQTIGNYRRFGPIWVACLFVTRQKGMSDGQRIEVESVDINPAIEESVFKIPVDTQQ